MNPDAKDESERCGYLENDNLGLGASEEDWPKERSVNYMRLDADVIV
jgi:hypothetical protein